MTSFYALVYGDEAMKPTSERGIIGASKVSLYAKIQDTVIIAVTAVV